MNGLCTTIVVQLVPEILNLPPELKRRIWLENRPRRLVAVGAETVEEVGFIIVNGADLYLKSRGDKRASLMEFGSYLSQL